MSNLKFYLYHEVFWALTLKISLSSQFPSHPQFLLFIMSLLNTREKKGQKKKKNALLALIEHRPVVLWSLKTHHHNFSKQIFQVNAMRVLFIEHLLSRTEHHTGFFIHMYHCRILWSVFYSLHFPDEEAEDYKSLQGHPWPDTLAHRRPWCKLEKCLSRWKQTRVYGLASNWCLCFIKKNKPLLASENSSCVRVLDLNSRI